MMPMQRDLYPANWPQIARRVKEAAGWVCQACGKQCRKPGEPFRSHVWTLTVAHVDGVPGHVDLNNLRALCAPCHIRLDARLHAEHARQTRNAAKRSVYDQKMVLEEAGNERTIGSESRR